MDPELQAELEAAASRGGGGGCSVERREPGKDEEQEDEDSYIRDVAAMWGHLDLIEPWLPHHRHEPAKVTEYVLFPAAMYGQLEVLKLALRDGEGKIVYHLDIAIAG